MKDWLECCVPPCVLDCPSQTCAPPSALELGTLPSWVIRSRVQPSWIPPPPPFTQAWCFCLGDTRQISATFSTFCLGFSLFSVSLSFKWSPDPHVLLFLPSRFLLQHSHLGKSAHIWPCYSLTQVPQGFPGVLGGHPSGPAPVRANPCPPQGFPGVLGGHPSGPAPVRAR